MLLKATRDLFLIVTFRTDFLVLLMRGPTAAKRNIKLYGENNRVRVLRVHHELFGNRNPLADYNPDDLDALTLAFNGGRTKEDQRSAASVYLYLREAISTRRGERITWQWKCAQEDIERQERKREKRPSESTTEVYIKDETEGQRVVQEQLLSHARKVQKIEIEIENEQDEFENEQDDLPEAVESLVTGVLVYDSVTQMYSDQEDAMRTEMTNLNDEFWKLTAQLAALESSMGLRVAALLANEELPPLPEMSFATLEARLDLAEANLATTSRELMLLVQRKDTELKLLHTEMHEEIVALMKSAPAIYDQFEVELRRRREI